MTMKISSLRNLLPVASLFQSSTLLNRPNEPMQELMTTEAIMIRRKDFNVLLYMVFLV